MVNKLMFRLNCPPTLFEQQRPRQGCTCTAWSGPMQFAKLHEVSKIQKKKKNEDSIYIDSKQAGLGFLFMLMTY